MTAAYLINRYPTKILKFKTPYDNLFGKRSSYHHLRVFRYLCFASAWTQGRAKLDPRSTPCAFLGYPYGKKGYKLFDLKNQIFLLVEMLYSMRTFFLS